LPETSGFWSEEIEQKGQPQTREEIYKGEKFVVADIRKIALFPTSVGQKTIGSLVLDCDVRVKRSRSRDIFDSFFDDPFFSRTIRRTISSKPIQITVDPLPAENKPANFSGAVGQFKLDTKVDKTRVKANEAITFTVTISGQGNIKILPRPKLNVSSDFEEYDPKITERITRADNSIRGYKTFEYVLVPRFPGEQIIEPVHFTYFDPSDKSYKTKSSPAFRINVEKSGEENLSFGQGFSKEEVRLIGKDIRFIKLKNPNLQRIDYHIYDQTIFYVLLAIPFIALMFSLVYQQQQKKLHKNEAYARSKRANKLAMKKLSKAKKLLHKNAQKEFYAEISHALTGFAADKLNVSAASIISTELENDFRKRNLNENLRGEYISLLQTCDFYRFGTGGGHLEEMKKIYERSKNAIINLEKAL
jgi:hypothetical protein